MKAAATIKLVLKYSLLPLMVILCLAGCTAGSSSPTLSPTAVGLPQKPPTILDPETARDVALAYLRTYHPGVGPDKNAFWFSENGNPEGQVEAITVTYRYEDWVVSVAFAVLPLDETIYTVTVERAAQDLYWLGEVNPYGELVEQAFSQSDENATAPPPTATAAQTDSQSPSATATSRLTETATATSRPTQTATVPPTQTPTATPLPAPCSAVEFLGDVTIPDGSTFYPGANFVKIWQLQNVGSCTWTGDYDLIFVDGSRMGADPSRKLPREVKPGESIDISIPLKAPAEPGDYQGLWTLRDGQGNLFGLGINADLPFWVSISVGDFDQDDYTYDLARDYCAASWRSAAGRTTCPGFIDSADGFVQLLSSADLENRREDEPTLWVHPNEDDDGYIEGRYPSYRVETGDHFRSWVGCLKGYNRCDLTFYLDYKDSSDRRYRLGDWTETQDGQITPIDLDLSHLAGERIHLILGVETNARNLGDSQGFWFVPRVE